MGRPATFDQSVFDEVCHRIASGETLRGVCRSDDKYPAPSTIRRWVVLDEPKGVAEQYARARESCIHEMVDEMMEIADDGSNDLMTVTKGDKEYEVENKEVVNRSRLRVDTRKFLAAKICPKLYGDKIQAEISGKDGGPLIVHWKTPQAPPTSANS